MVLDLLVDPDRFYQRELERDGFVRPTAIVAILGVVSAVSGLPVVQATFRAMPAEVSGFAVFGYAAVIGGGFIGAFVIWLIYAVAFLLIARVAFDGEGSFRRTLRATAWGFVPAIVAAAVAGVIAFYAVQSVTFPSDPARIQAFAAQLQRRPLFLASGVIGVLFLLWQAFIWTFGVKHAQDIPLRDAAITVAIPVAIAILIRVYSLV